MRGRPVNRYFRVDLGALLQEYLTKARVRHNIYIDIQFIQAIRSLKSFKLCVIYHDLNNTVFFFSS